MKMKSIIVFLLLFPIPGLAQTLTTWDKNVVQTDTPNPIYQSGTLKRITHYFGRQIVQTFTDLGRDREWLFVFGVDTLAQTTDYITTCKGFKYGFAESNPFLGRTNSCGKLALGMSLLHTAKWVGTHATTHELVQQCWYEKYNGSSQQKSSWTASTSPSGCRHVMWMGLLSTPFHIKNSLDNVNRLP